MLKIVMVPSCWFGLPHGCEGYPFLPLGLMHHLAKADNGKPFQQPNLYFPILQHRIQCRFELFSQTQPGTDDVV